MTSQDELAIATREWSRKAAREIATPCHSVAVLEFSG
jgi:hypothetical protein